MSGYLQRLVETAAGRSDSVHPRTGSIFSPRLEEIRPPLQGWEETEYVTTAQPPHSRATPLALEPLESQEPPRRVRPESEHAPLLPKLVAPDTRSTAPAPPPVPAVPSPAGGPVDALDAQSWEPRAEPTGSPLTAEADPHLTVPAPAPRNARDAFRAVMKPARVFETVARATAPADLPRQRHAARAPQQADDIQIHIGRIEVTAVPPPAPRAPKAPDRGLSLDAYLNRRDGRAR